MTDRGEGASPRRPAPPNLFERVVRRADRIQQRHVWLAFPVAVFQKFGNDQGGARAALIAYYGLFALFPLLLLFTTVLGYVLQGDPSLRQRLVDSALGTFPVIGGQLQSPTQKLQGSGAAVVIGAVLLLYGAVGVGQAVQAGMNAVWNFPYAERPGFVPRHLRSVAVLMLIGASTIGSTVLTGFATVVSHGTTATAVLVAGSLALNFVLIMAAFQVVTAERMPWRDMTVGAGLATVFWQVLQAAGSWYIARGLHHDNDTYGLFAVVIILLSWIYLGAQLFLLAAEINVVLRYRLWPRSIVQPPLTGADRQVFERLARVSVRRPEAVVSVTFTADADRDPMAGRPVIELRGRGGASRPAGGEPSSTDGRRR